VARVTWARVVAYGTTAAYYGGLPLVVLLARHRRGLQFSDLLRALRLPFTE
jgi:hypothetical protein